MRETVDEELDHIRAQYPDREFFRHREVFLRHVIGDFVSSLPQAPEGGAPAVLDVGCNTGRYTAMLVRHGLRARGVDLSAELLRAARARHPDIVFDEGDAQQLRHPDASFDGVSSLGVLQVVGDWRQALHEAVRVVKPGGLALFETNRAFPLWESLLKSALYLARRTLPPREVQRFLEAHRMAGTQPHGMRKFAMRDLRPVLEELPVSHVVVHDPLKHRLAHHFIWAVTLTRSAGDGGTPTFAWCQGCRRQGVSAWDPQA